MIIVVGINLILALGLFITAWGIWRSRPALRQLTQEMSRLEMELAATLATAPAAIATYQNQLQALKQRQQQLAIQISFVQQLAQLLFWMYQYRSRSGRSSSQRRS